MYVNPARLTVSDSGTDRLRRQRQRAGARLRQRDRAVRGHRPRLPNNGHRQTRLSGDGRFLGHHLRRRNCIVDLGIRCRSRTCRTSSTKLDTAFPDEDDARRGTSVHRRRRLARRPRQAPLGHGDGDGHLPVRPQRHSAAGRRRSRARTMPTSETRSTACSTPPATSSASSTSTTSAFRLYNRARAGARGASARQGVRQPLAVQRAVPAAAPPPPGGGNPMPPPPTGCDEAGRAARFRMTDAALPAAPARHGVPVRALRAGRRADRDQAAGRPDASSDHCAGATVRPGPNAIRFNGRAPRARALQPGRYVAVLFGDRRRPATCRAPTGRIPRSGVLSGRAWESDSAEETDCPDRNRGQCRTSLRSAPSSSHRRSCGRS